MPGWSNRTFDLGRGARASRWAEALLHAVTALEKPELSVALPIDARGPQILVDLGERLKQLFDALSYRAPWVPGSPEDLARLAEARCTVGRVHAHWQLEGNPDGATAPAVVDAVWADLDAARSSARSRSPIEPAG